jgi:hypothetical protein
MKHFFISLAIFVFVIAPVVASSQEGIITSNKLEANNNLVNSIKTVRFNSSSGGGRYSLEYKNMDINSVKVVGIHQEGVSATIYCSFISNGKQRIGYMSVIRFNSGKWYIPQADKYLGQ